METFALVLIILGIAAVVCFAVAFFVELAKCNQNDEAEQVEQTDETQAQTQSEEEKNEDEFDLDAMLAKLEAEAVENSQEQGENAEQPAEDAKQDENAEQEAEQVSEGEAQEVVEGENLKLYLRHNKNKDTNSGSNYTSYDYSVGTGYLSFYYKAYNLSSIFYRFSGSSVTPKKIDIVYEANPYSWDLDDAQTETKTYTVEYKPQTAE